MLAWHAYAERAGAEPGAYLGASALARVGIHAIFTTRLGGMSDAPHGSLNLSYVAGGGAGDDPGIVRANRGRALSAIGLEASAWTGGRQVHGIEVARITADQRGSGAESPASTIPGTDALWTDQPGIALAVLVADCVPILLADPARRRIAVVHAGWRGLVGGMVERAAKVFVEPASIVALAGPSIGPCCYQVGDDVAVPARDRFGDGVLRGANLDLWAATWAAFQRAGIRDATVAGLCTRCESHRFYSHRAGDGGRQAVLACLS